MCRGNNKQIVFRSSEDKLKYYSLLFDLKAENCVGILHYCLMDNHLHLIVWVHEGSRLARFMLQVNLGYFFISKENIVMMVIFGRIDIVAILSKRIRI